MQIPFVISPPSGLAAAEVDTVLLPTVEATEAQAVQDGASFSCLVQAQEETRLPDPLSAAWPFPVSFAQEITLPVSSFGLVPVLVPEEPTDAAAFDPLAVTQGLPSGAPAPQTAAAFLMSEEAQAETGVKRAEEAVPNRWASLATPVAQGATPQPQPPAVRSPLSPDPPEVILLKVDSSAKCPTDAPSLPASSAPSEWDLLPQAKALRVGPMGVPDLPAWTGSLSMGLRFDKGENAGNGFADAADLIEATLFTTSSSGEDAPGRPGLPQVDAKFRTALEAALAVAGTKVPPDAGDTGTEAIPSTPVLPEEVGAMSRVGSTAEPQVATQMQPSMPVLPMVSVLPQGGPNQHPAALALRLPVDRAAKPDTPEGAQDQVDPLPKRLELPKLPLALSPTMRLFWVPPADVDIETGGFSHNPDPQASGFSTPGTLALPMTTQDQARLPGASLVQTANQIIAVLAQGQAAGTASFTLAPEELGLVRLKFHSDPQKPDQLIVTLGFDRPETMDLFRRHADQLADALRSAGYSGVQIGFGSPADDGSAPQQDQRQEAEALPNVPAASTWQDQTNSVSHARETSALDLRL